MNLYQVELFLDVCRTHSINKSAANFYITRQSATSAIRKLESELGYQLFEHSVLGTELSDKGRIAYQSFKQIKESYNALKRIGDDPHSNIAITIQMPPILSLVSQIPGQKMKINSQVSIRTLLSSNQDVFSALSVPESNCLYIFYRNEPIEEAQVHLSNIEVMLAARDRLCAIAKLENPVAKRNYFSKRDLKTYGAAIYQPYADALRSNGDFFGLKITFDNVSYTPASLAAMLQVVEDSNVLGLLPELIAKTIRDASPGSIAVLPCKPDLPLYWYYAWRNDVDDRIRHYFMNFGPILSNQHV